MPTTTPTPVRSFLELLRRDKTHIKATTEELSACVATAKAEGKTGMIALYEASRVFETESRASGDRSVCFGTDCDEDHCRCHDEEN